MRIGTDSIGGGVRIGNAIITRVTASAGGGARGVRLTATSTPAAPARSSLRTGGSGGRLHILGYQHAVEDRLNAQLMFGEVKQRR